MYFSKKYLLVYLVIGAIAYALIYYFVWGKKSYQNATQYTNYNQTVPTPKQWRVDLKGQNGSKLDGSALLTEENGKTKVVLAFANYSTIQMPAHIHVGSCPKPGAVKYPLTSVVNGRSETTIPVTIDELKTMSPLAINVHKSVVELSVYVSCGDLK